MERMMSSKLVKIAKQLLSTSRFSRRYMRTAYGFYFQIIPISDIVDNAGGRKLVQVFSEMPKELDQLRNFIKIENMPYPIEDEHLVLENGKVYYSATLELNGDTALLDKVEEFLKNIHFYKKA